MSKKQLSEGTTLWDLITKAVGRSKLHTVKKLSRKDKELAKITKSLEKARKDYDSWYAKYKKSQGGKDMYTPQSMKKYLK